MPPRSLISTHWPHGRASFSRLTLQRYNSVSRDVKRHPRFGGDLTLRGLVILSAAKNLSAQAKYYIADVYRFFGSLRMTRNGSSCLLAIFVPFNNCKIGICKDNSCFVQQGGGKGRTGGTHKCNYSYYRLQITVR